FLSTMPQAIQYSRKTIIAAIIIVGFLFSLIPILPGSQSVSDVAGNFIEVTAAFAHYAGPLSRTIAEENPTDAGFLAGAFGILNPIILLLVAILIAWSAIEILLSKKREKLALIFAAAALVGVLVHDVIGEFAVTLGQNIGLRLLSTLGKLLLANDVFSYLLVATIASMIVFICSKEEQRNDAALLAPLVIYPVAYIGLNKSKFIVHLGVALVVTVGVLIGEIINRAKFIHEFFKVGDKLDVSLKWTTGFAVVLLIILGSVQVFGLENKAPGVFNTMAGAGYSQISPDWLLAMDWLKNNTSYRNPTLDAVCVAKFGSDCRVISWWDYGHWTSFLGETKTALDPGNSFEFLDQQVAYGFVDNATAFNKIVEFHNATHVLVDYELIEKWGALVFLSGTCQKTADNATAIRAPFCPNERQIKDWQRGAGASEYELEHQFDRLTVKGQCPFAQSMALLQSSFGPTYCLSQDQIIPVDRSGLRTDLARGFKSIDLKSKIENVDLNTSYLISVSQNVLIDANPNLSLFGRNSSIVNAAYTRLYLFENLPGYKLVYSSPLGEVKIFERTFNTK
ncbi:MAG: hypothetical protein V1722_03655, partial [Candidatus Micrarchaeota archaeon]